MTTVLSHAPTPSGPSPAYTPQNIELSRLNSASSSTYTAPPPYDETTPPSFHPTLHLQIETPGKQWLSLPLAPRPDPVPIIALHPDESSASAATHAPQFTSLRPTRCSGSSYLTSPTNTVLGTTTFRFGPNRPPRIRLFHPTTTPQLSESTIDALLFSKDDSSLSENNIHPWDDFTLTPLGLLTRAVAFRTRLGTFQWRYASRKERHAHSHSPSNPHGEISNLLILERVVRVANAQASSSRGGDESSELRTPIAHLLRGPSTRSPGSGASTAGNGGRLVIDERALLSPGLGLEGLEIEEGGDAADAEKKKLGKEDEEREMGIVMVVATCLVMLKREIDRRRAQQAMIMGGAAGGGP